MVLAAVRVLVFAAAFPFWNPIDEHLHFDVAQKYARGFLPGREEARFDAVSARLIAESASPEYLAGPEAQPGGRFATPDQVRARRPPGSARERAALASLTRRVNVEADAPPTYYALAGAWLRLGRGFGLDGPPLLYWLRALGALFAAAAVWLTWQALRDALPAARFERLAAPLLVAVWPNDLLYGITPDAFALLLGAAGFAALVRLRQGGASLALHLAAGLLFGVAFLNKYPAVVYAALAAAWGLGALRRAASAERRALALRWAATGLAAALPAGWWLERNVRVIGSLSGQHRKLVWLHWTPQDLEGILSHPLFGWRGWPDFATTFLGSFWRGEFVWHGRVQHLAWVDAVYLATSLALLALAGARFLGRRRTAARAGGAAPAGLQVEGTAWSIVLASVALLAALSTLFDYGIEQGPLSRAHPYLASGRLVAGAWPPFALLYTRGLATLWSRAPARVSAIGRWVSLAALALLAVASEAWTSASAFTSPWNLFHLP